MAAVAVKSTNAPKGGTVKKSPIPSKSKPHLPQSIDSPVKQIFYLQRTIGNRAVTRLIQSGALQAKLRVGPPNDIYEQEADRMADRVMRMPQGEFAPPPASSPNPTNPLAEQITPLVRRQPDEKDEEVQSKSLLQRQEEEEEIQEKPLIQRQNEEEEEAQLKPLIQRQVDDEKEEEPIQAKSNTGNTTNVTPNIESDINSLKGGGQPLSESTRAFFEPRFGADFSQVRIHTDTKAAQTAQSINAKAFTTGKDIAFNSGQYSADTASGKHLLAHELTHVVQQGNSSGIKKANYAFRNAPVLQSSGIVLQRKLDPRRVKYADQELWVHHPELKGRKLTMRKSDAQFRKEWWMYYKFGENMLTKKILKSKEYAYTPDYRSYEKMQAAREWLEQVNKPKGLMYEKILETIEPKWLREKIKEFLKKEIVKQKREPDYSERERAKQKFIEEKRSGGKIFRKVFIPVCAENIQKKNEIKPESKLTKHIEKGYKLTNYKISGKRILIKKWRKWILFIPIECTSIIDEDGDSDYILEENGKIVRSIEGKWKDFSGPWVKSYQNISSARNDLKETGKKFQQISKSSKEIYQKLIIPIIKTSENIQDNALYIEAIARLVLLLLLATAKWTNIKIINKLIENQVKRIEEIRKGIWNKQH